MSNIFRETLHRGLVQEIKIKKNIIDKKSVYQRIQIFDTYTYGRVLALDGIVQITERDEQAYSEMLVHPAINVLQKPEKILIVGGGDGAVAEELLKYEFIKVIDLVDIDPDVVSLSKKYFKKINKGSLVNERVSVFEEDAFNYTKNSKQFYDLVIADRPDPVGVGKKLFTINFYKNIKKILKRDGIAIFQSGVPFLQKKETKIVYSSVKNLFKNNGIILTVVPSYIGGYMALIWASDKNKFKKRKKKRKFNIETYYYNDNLLTASQALPNFLKVLK